MEDKTQLTMKQIILNSINEMLETKVTQVKNSFPSLYSKEDVIVVLTKYNEMINTFLETKLDNTTNNSGFTIDEIFDTIQNDLNVNDYCSPDCDSAEFELDGNTIYLNHCEFTYNYREFLSDLKDKLNELRNNN